VDLGVDGGPVGAMLEAAGSPHSTTKIVCGCLQLLVFFLCFIEVYCSLLAVVPLQQAK
jgi:hypothetical protein